MLKGQGYNNKNGTDYIGTYLLGEDGNIYFADIKDLMLVKTDKTLHKTCISLIFNHFKNKVFNFIKHK